MLLYAHPPAFGLPSADPECNAAIAYCLLTIPGSFSVDYSATKASLITGVLPSLHDTNSGIWLGGLAAIQAHLRKIGLVTDSHVSDAAEAETIALQRLMRSSAYDLMLLYLFDDADNYEVYLKTAKAPWLARFPLSLLSTNDLVKERFARIDELAPKDQQESNTIFKSRQSEVMRHKASQMRLVEKADTIYALLEASLSNTPYLCGPKPTSIDCIVFGYLSLHLFPDVPNDFLAKRIQESFPRTWRYLVDLKEVLLDKNALEIASTESRPMQEHLANIVASVKEYMFGSQKDSETANKPEHKQDWLKKAAFAGSVLAVLGTFIWANQLIVIDFTDDDDQE